MNESNYKKYMLKAISEARMGVSLGDGGPFGSIIVNSKGDVIGSGHNCVIGLKDPTAHGELQAIRDATKNISSINLSDCYIFITAEPCIMCFAAISWSNILPENIIYGCSSEDITSIGFRDTKIANIFCGDKHTVLEMKQYMRDECYLVFEEWKASRHANLY